MNPAVRTAIRFLLLGGVLNVIVCWYCMGIATFPESRGRYLIGEDRLEPWAIKRYDSTGGMLVTASLNDSIFSEKAMELDLKDLPNWCGMDTMPAYQAGELTPKTHAFAYGWPMLGLSMSYHSLHNIHNGAILQDEFRGSLPGLEIPARIIPFGFIINTSIYALASWLLALPFMWLRSRWRIRQGLCCSCGADLKDCTEKACPGCGFTNPVRPAHTVEASSSSN
ncbi:MAG: hypothetical protein O7G85_07050 [Planctomycetota bacterium]|nr:hypothetical protein [Planctomycetota bacterium]